MSGETVDDIDDRGRGVLTLSDREFLLKTEDEREEDYSRQSRSGARTRIRARAKNSILDFALLFEHLDEDERKQIFKEATSDTNQLSRAEYESRRDFRNAIANTLGFLYLGTLTGEYGFEYYLTLGVKRAEDRAAGEGEEVNAEVNLKIERKSFPTADMESIVERVRDGGFDELTEHELREYTKLTAGMDEFDPESILEANLDRYRTGVESTDFDTEP
jgi:hypothetical protein